MMYISDTLSIHIFQFQGMEFNFVKLGNVFKYYVLFDVEIVEVTKLKNRQYI